VIVGWWLFATFELYWGVHPFPAYVIMLILLCCSSLSIVGGILAVRRKNYKASLAGAICALPTVLFGILSVIFVAMRKNEFEVEASGW